jgi:hypothetical protein
MNLLPLVQLMLEQDATLMDYNLLLREQQYLNVKMGQK